MHDLCEDKEEKQSNDFAILVVNQQSTTLNDSQANEENEVLITPEEPKETKPVTFFRAWLLPGVAMVNKIER